MILVEMILPPTRALTQAEQVVNWISKMPVEMILTPARAMHEK